MTAWLDKNCGADGREMTLSRKRGVLSDALSIYFLDATLASAFAARGCAGNKVETAEGVSAMTKAGQVQRSYKSQTAPRILGAY